VLDSRSADRLGGTGAGRRPDNGVLYRVVENDDEMALIRRIRTMRAEGMSRGRIAAALNAEGLRGKMGGRFHASTVQHVLANPIQRPA
jgi:hypothetical protein